jgi:hypothetical protein
MADSILISAQRAGELKEQLTKLTAVSLPKLHSHKLVALKDEAVEDFKLHDRVRDGVKKYILATIDSSQLPLSSLVNVCRQQLMADFPDLCMASEEISELIMEVSTRKAFGLRGKDRNRLEDVEPGSLWVWELRDHPQPVEVRKERRLLGKELMSLEVLVEALGKTYVEPADVSVMYDTYIGAMKTRDNYYQAMLSRKRKLEVREEERSAKKMLGEEHKLKKKMLGEEHKLQAKLEKEEKKLLLKEKAETERQAKHLARLEERSKKQRENEEAKRMQREERKKQQEEAIVKRQEAKPGKSLDEKRPKNDGKTDMRPISAFFTKRAKPVSEARASTEESDVEPMKIEGQCPEDWREFWKTQTYLPLVTRDAFIYIHDSALKPYFIGRGVKTRLRRDFLKPLAVVDYDRDSEEEFEEQNAEDLGEEDCSSDEDSEASDESGAEFVVPDNYLSDEEFSQGERTELKLRTTECKPLAFLTQAQLMELSVISISSLQFPIQVERPRLSSKDEDWVPDLLEVVEGKASKTEVLSALRER